MAINWDAVIKLASSLSAVVVAWGLKAWSERGAKLIAYYGHTSSVLMPPTEGSQEPTAVHTHAVVIKNVGKKTAKNVRVSHQTLPPAFSLWPPVPFTLEDVPNAGKDIVIPTLVPDQEVTINYLYFPPLLVTGVTRGVRTDEGFARVVTVLPTPAPSRWVALSRAALMLVGGATVIYWTAVAVLAAVTGLRP